MANAAVLKEYLVAVGMKDNLSGPMQRTLRQSQANIKQFAKSVTMAGSAMAGLLLAANAGIAKFASGLVQTDDRIKKLADDMNITHEEANKVHHALNAMGKSLEEIEASPELSRQFQQLQRDAAAITIPDMSEGLNQVRAIQGEFLRLRNTASHAFQWIGHHLLKYLHQPMEKLRDVFSNLNSKIIVSMPDWTRRIAGVMASVVNITASVIRGAAAIFNGIKRVFDMIPKEVKILTGILAAFVAFIRAGPVGKLMMIFALLMLLVEDFFVYLDGGEALLGGFWGWLIKIWEKLNESGGIIDRMKTAFTGAMDAVVGAILWIIDWISGLYNRMQELGVIENWGDTFTRVGEAIGNVFDAVKTTLSVLLSGFSDGADTVQPFLAWLLAVALPDAIGLIADLVSGVADAISWFMNLNYAKEILIGLGKAIGAIIIAKKVWAGVQTILNAIMMANPITLIILAVLALIAIVILLVKNWDKVAEFFKGLWERIKNIFKAAIDTVVGFFKGIIDWIKDNFKSIVLFIINPFAGVFNYLYENFEGFRNFIDNIVSAIKNFFVGLWEKIKDVFSAVAEWFHDKFNQAVESINEVFSVIVEFFSGIWGDIVGVFSVVVDFFKEVFGNAYDEILSIFSGIIDFFSGIWEGVLKGIRGFADKAIGFLQPIMDFIGGIGNFVGGLFGGKKNNAADTLPGHAEGGIFDKPHIANFAEDGPEAVIPLTKPGRAKEILGGVMNYLNNGRQAIKSLDSGMQQQAQNVNNTNANTINNYNISMPSSYNINDTSGRPEQVATAVERKEQQKIRNLQACLNT